MQSIDDILGVLEKWSAEKEPVDPAAWLEAGMKMTALLGNESDQLFLAEQQVARRKMELMEQGFTAAKARVFVEAEDTYREARARKAKIERVIEMVRLAKHRSRLASEEFKAQG